MSTLPNQPLSWLDKLLGAGVSTVQSSGTSVAQETTVDFTGIPVVDDPVNGRTIVKIDNELTVPVAAGIYCPTGTTTLLAEVDLVLDALGSVALQGSCFGNVGGSITGVEYSIGYGTVTPADNIVQHRKLPSSDDLRYGGTSAVVPGLTVDGSTKYRFGFYVKPDGDSMTVTGGAFNAREARR